MCCAAGIAEHDLEFGAEHVVVERRILHRRRARAGGADGGDALLGVLQRLGRRGVPDHEQLVGEDHIGDPVELAQVGLELRRHAERLVGGEPLADDADHGAVMRRDLRHVVGGRDAAAARHVDDDHRRIAGDVLAHEAGDQPRILIVVGGRRGPHDDADLLAAVEVGDRHRPWPGAAARRCSDAGQSRRLCASTSRFLPCVIARSTLSLSIVVTATAACHSARLAAWSARCA